MHDPKIVVLQDILKEFLIDLTNIFPEDDNLYFYLEAIDSASLGQKTMIFNDVKKCLELPVITQAIADRDMEFFKTLDIESLELDLECSAYFNILDQLKEVESFFDTLDDSQVTIIWDYIDVLHETIEDDLD